MPHPLVWAQIIGPVVAQAADPMPGWAGSLLSLGGFGLLLLLLLTDRLYTPSAYKAVVEDRDAWREAYESERTARLAAEDRAATALETSKLGLDILQALQQQQAIARAAADADADLALRSNPARRRRTDPGGT